MNNIQQFLQHNWKCKSSNHSFAVGNSNDNALATVQGFYISNAYLSPPPPYLCLLCVFAINPVVIISPFEQKMERVP